MLRTYSRAVFYSYPSMESIGDVTLPAQQQGEGIAVDERSRVSVSSEGLQAPVLRVGLPPSIRREVPPKDAPGPGPSPVVPEGEPDPEPDPERPLWPWLVPGAFGALMIVVLLRALRPR